MMAAVLASCANRSLKPSVKLLDSQSQPQDWSFSGRLALANGRDGGSGQLSWEQAGETSELQFVGAFGRGSWQLSVVPGEAVLRLNDGRVYRAGDVKQLIDQHSQWDIPLDALQNWVLGLPANTGKVSTRTDKIGRLEVLVQQGWRVTYNGYYDVDGTWLPRKLYAKKDGNTVRLIVKQWQISG